MRVQANRSHTFVGLDRSLYDTVVDHSTVEIPTRLLVLGMAHDDGTILASELFPVAEACGQTPEQLRSCLRRLAREDLFVREGKGRSARFIPTPNGLAALSASAARTRLAYAQDAAGRGWDGQWRLVAFALPENQRKARNTFRDHLLQLGGSAIQAAMYLSPHLWHDDVRIAAESLGIAEYVTLAVTNGLDVGGVRDPRELARRLWTLDELATRYQGFIERYSWLPDQLDSMRGRQERIADTAFLPGALAVAVAFRECFDDDPLLPPELLPRPWPGRAARDLLARCRTKALSLREDRGGPSLFRAFDETLDALP